MCPAYYNEHDRFAARWLRNLISAGLIAPGDVDERSIEDVHPSDLRGYAQCHWFAGIGGWPYALRLAGWPDDRPAWTGSCPCPPFSVAGRKKKCPSCQSAKLVPHVGRTGYFVCCQCQHEWFADARHLWPEMWRLISGGRPRHFYGEQVAGSDGETWLASVRASLEILRYDVRAASLNAAGVGAPHIRQRLYFVADADQQRMQPDDSRGGGEGGGPEAEPGRHYTVQPRGRGASGGLGDAQYLGPQGQRKLGREEEEGRLLEPQGSGDFGSRRMGNASSVGREGRGGGPQLEPAQGKAGGPSAINGFWFDPEWLPCRDGKSRPVESGTFPLADGVPERMGRLRAYGNAIVPQLAAEFIRAHMQVSDFRVAK